MILFGLATDLQEIVYVKYMNIYHSLTNVFKGNKTDEKEQVVDSNSSDELYEFDEDHLFRIDENGEIDIILREKQELSLYEVELPYVVGFDQEVVVNQ